MVRSVHREGVVAGPRKPNDDVVASFFGDDDDDFFKDDEEESEPAVAEAPPAEPEPEPEPVPVAEPEPAATEPMSEPDVGPPASEPTAAVEPEVAEPVETPAPEPATEAEPVAAVEAEPVAVVEAEPVAEPVIEPLAAPVAEVVEEPVAEPVDELAEPVVEPVAASAADPVETPVEAEVAVSEVAVLAAAAVAAEAEGGTPRLPPPPPRYVAPTRAAGGYLDSILPKTLEAPRPASVAPPLTHATDVVDSLGEASGSSRAPERRAEFVLPQGRDAWLEAAAAIEASAAFEEDEERKVALLLQAAELRLDGLADVSGARARLDDVRRIRPSGVPASSRVACTVVDEASAWDVWSARAAVSTGAAASDAWQRAASAVKDATRQRAALAAAIAAEPADLAALERWTDLVRALGDDQALIDALHARVALDDEAAAPALHAGRGAAYARLERFDEAAAAWREALALDPAYGAADCALEAALLASADHAALAALYTSRAEASGDGAAWWQAARALRAAGDETAAGAAVASARSATRPARAALVEHEAWLLRSGSADALGAFMTASLSEASGESAAIGWYRLGAALEVRGADAAEVLAAYRRASDLGFSPAAEAVVRAQAAAGHHGANVALYEARVAAWDVPRLADLVRLAEAREAAEPASAATLAGWRAAAERGEPTAWASVRRLAKVVGDAEALALSTARVAELDPDPTVRAARAHDAGRLALDAGDPTGAAAWFERAAAPGPDGVPLLGEALSSESIVDALAAAGQLAAASDRVLARAAAADGEVAVARYLEAARLRRPLGVDAELTALDALLARFPDEAVALRRVAMIAGARRPAVVRGALRAEGGRESLLADATLALLAGESVPDGLGASGDALQALSVALDPSSLVAVVAADADEVATLEATVVLLGASEPSRVLGALRGAGDGVGSLTLARAAERLGDAGLAQRFAASADLPRGESARLALLAAPDAASALAAVVPDLDAEDASSSSLARVARVAASAGVVDVQRRAHERAWLAGGTPAQRVWHGSWVASLRQASGDAVGALEVWQALIDLRPGSLTVAEGARAAAIAARDVDVVRDVYARTAAYDASTRSVAFAVEAAGGAAPVDLWRTAAASGELLDLSGLERALADAEQWTDLFEAWSTRLATTQAPVERQRLEAKRRWVLAEKMADQDIAWEAYLALHADAPEDRDVLENLARIAGKRGEADLSIDYLSNLAATASTARDGARYRRRIAEVLVAEGRDAEAQKTLVEALDLCPEDLGALEALRELAERTGDHDTLLAVAKREVALVPPAKRVALLRKVADVAQHQLGDPRRAIEAWRQVLAETPGDTDALTALVALADEVGDIDLYVEAGQGLVARTAGPERSVVLRQLGEKCEAAGRSDDAVNFLEQAVASEHPDARAAAKLVEVYGLAADHAGTVRALTAQAGLTDDPAEQVALLRRAVSIELELRHDRDAAHRLSERVLALDDSQVDALRFEAQYLYDAGRHAEAVHVCERLEPVLAASLDEDDDDARMELTGFYFRFAEMLRTEGRIAAAVDRYRAALAVNPSHLPTLEAIGPIHAAEGRWAEAGEVYQRVLNLTGGQGEPEQVASLYTMLGQVDRHNGKPDKAHKRFTKALEVFPNHVPALKGLAAVHADRRDWQGLLNAYNSVIYNASVASDVVEAYMTKGRVLDEELGRPDKAAQHYERSLAFDAAQPKAYLRLAELALRREAWDEAADFATRGLGFVGEDASTAAVLHLAVSASRLMVDDAVSAADAVAKARALDASRVAALGDAPLADPAALMRVVREGVSA